MFDREGLKALGFGGATLALALVAVVALGAPLAATGAHVLPSALEPASTGGAEAVDRALAKLSQNRRLLVIGAHPDDEDTSTLARVARGDQGEAAYLSLSRGEGGQNLTGTELGLELGIVRSHELLAARRVDGARQYFARAFDFGYTRSLDETLRFWPEPLLLEDVVRVMRRFRPQVVLSVFGNDASGGHGQHQAAGRVAHEAFPLAGDAAALPQLGAEGLVPWSPQALYRGAFFAPERATAKTSLGVVDPWSGLSIAQLARLSRSQHHTQAMGRLLDLGGAETLAVWEAGAGEGGHDLFAGVDTTLASIAATIPDAARRAAVARELDAAGTAAREARARLLPGDLAPAARALETISTRLDAADAALRGCSEPGCVAAAGLIDEKRAVAAEGLAAALGLVLDAAVDREALVPGEGATLTVTIWNTGSAAVDLTRLEIATAFGAVTPPAGLPRPLAAGELVKLDVALAPPATAAPTVPGYLARPLAGEMYDWTALSPAERGEPFGPAVVSVRLAFASHGAAGELGRDAVARSGDPAIGEVRRPLRIVPRLEVTVAPGLVVLPLGRATLPRLRVALRSNARAPLAGDLRLELPCAGAARPLGRFQLAAAGAEATFDAPLPSCAGAGRDRARVVARMDDGEELVGAYPLVAPPLVPPTPEPRAAATTVVRIDLALPKLRSIAYVPGAADQLPELLAEVGLPVEVVSGETLASVDLARYDVVVIGPRAFSTDDSLPRANARLLDWVRGGGTMIVQYQQSPFTDGNLAPLPLTFARPADRVTDETAPVTVLAPAGALSTTPNRLTAEDWEGWVQERTLYVPHEWDAGWTPFVEMKDPDQPPTRGALLEAKVGKGRYVYTGIAFFRELPAGVPGAWRLFANLLTLGEAKR
jgi:LmbE family N-acetylglucosaminyl deacetylase